MDTSFTDSKEEISIFDRNIKLVSTASIVET